MPCGFVYSFFFQQALCYGAFRQVGLHRLCSFSVEQRYLSVDHNYHKIVFSLTMELLKRLSPFSIRQKAVNCLFSGKILSLLMECPIDHFTVVCLVTWPLDGSEARVDLVLIQTSLLLLCKTSCSDVNKVHLHDKSREVCIKTRSTLASLPSTGQVAEQTTVKWSIAKILLLEAMQRMLYTRIQNKRTYMGRRVLRV